MRRGCARRTDVAAGNFVSEVSRDEIDETTPFLEDDSCSRRKGSRWTASAEEADNYAYATFHHVRSVVVPRAAALAVASAEQLQPSAAKRRLFAFTYRRVEPRDEPTRVFIRIKITLRRMVAISRGEGERERERMTETLPARTEISVEFLAPSPRRDAPN